MTLTESYVSDRSRRHHLSVMAIFRNEGHILQEWIRHYLMFGVEHFYLIDNNSTDDYLGHLSPFIERGLVDLYSCPRDGYQNGAYTELLPLLRDGTEWVGVIDLDEFIYPTDGALFSAVLERYRDFDAVLTPWLSFGSNGHLHQPELVVDNFTRRGQADVSRAFLKAFSRPAEITEFSQHNPKTARQRKVLANGKAVGDDLFIRLTEAQLSDFALINNHYRLQSRHYFESVKTMRPEVNEAAQGKIKALSFFEEYDAAWNQVEDLRLSELAREKSRAAPLV